MHGPWLIFKIQQEAVRTEIKQQIKAGVPEDQLVKLKIAKTWEEEPNNRFKREHSKEFRFDGEWYDVMRSKDLGDTTLYVCIHDVKEGKLFNRLAEMTHAEMSQPHQEQKRSIAVSSFISDYHFEPEQEAPFRRSFTELLCDRRIIQTQTCQLPISPPPNLVFFS